MIFSKKKRKTYLNKSLIYSIFLKSYYGLKSENAKSYLSYVWLVLEPILHMLAYYMVFEYLLNRGTDNYAVFLLTGLIPWFWFNKTVSGSVGAIIGSKPLISQIYIHKSFFPLVIIVKESLRQMLLFFILFIFLFLYGVDVSMTWFGLFILILIEFLLIVSISLLIASIVPFIPDLKYFVNSGLQFLMFASGIFYSYEQISEDSREIFFLNPIALLLKDYREIYLNNTLPDFSAYVIFVFIFIVITIFSLFVINKYDKHYLKVI